MTNRFQEIYINNEWKYGSGEGSLAIHTSGYRIFLQKFLLQNKIRSVIDMGCGDWQFSKLIDWSGIHYQGFDVAPEIITRNNGEFRQNNISFSLYDGNAEELPAADLLIAKDVLQHLPNSTILDILPSLTKYKYALITNCTNPQDGNKVNNDIVVGDFRYLDLRMPPFHLRASLVYTFCATATNLPSKIKTMIRGYPRWKKLVLLVDNSGDHYFEMPARQ